jgi:NDP-sugar pyrophosphorylase family protein
MSIFHLAIKSLHHDLPDSEIGASVIDWYLAIADKHKIMGHRHDNDLWCDVGKIETLPEAEAVARLMVEQN